MKKRLRTAVIAVILLVLAASLLYCFPAEQLPAPLRPVAEVVKTAVHAVKNQIDPQPEASEVLYPVLWVYDGDTILVRVDEKDVTVRMIGIDAPESVHRDETKNTPEGETASAWLKEFLKGKSVALEYDRETTDQYGRTLAYVYADGELVEDALLKAGMARVLILEPNNKYEKHLEACEKEAQRSGAGFWGTGFFAD